jgi:uroporphyrinogen decarboxylase
VAAETKLCLDELGPDGYLPCSCHFAQADTPVENIMALIQTVQRYSR